jgi:hypothetical protein
MSQNMMNRAGSPNVCNGGAPLAKEVTELLLVLPGGEFSALEEAAHRLSLTVGQLIRRTVSDFLSALPSQ